MILVDTHAVIWLSQEQELLSTKARALLEDGRLRGSLAIADISLREIALLVVRRRVAVGASLDVYLRFIESLYLVLPITGPIAERSTQFSSLFPKDPADRLIGATAVVHGARLVTGDELIRASGEVDCVW
jgi:PIN domain nuclease of toxin-antitoxin system